MDQKLEELGSVIVELIETASELLQITKKQVEDIEEICQKELFSTDMLETLKKIDEKYEQMMNESDEEFEEKENEQRSDLIDMCKMEPSLKELIIELMMNTDGEQCGSDNRQSESETFESFGLSIDFLQQHNIEPPLCDRISIENLAPNVGTEKIYEVFGMAGKITWMDLRIDKEGKSKGICVLEYSHPVEAVQAITMFNGQKLYDQNLVVKMDRIEKDEQEFKDEHLPEGLTSIGMGLGDDGAPLVIVCSVCGGGGGENEPAPIQHQPRNGAIGQGGQQSGGRIIEEKDLPNNITWQTVRDRLSQLSAIELIEHSQKFSKIVNDCY